MQYIKREWKINFFLPSSGFYFSLAGSDWCGAVQRWFGGWCFL